MLDRDVDLSGPLLQAGEHGVEPVMVGQPRSPRSATCVSASADEARAEAIWQVPPGTPAAAVLDAYRRETELADAVIAVTPLDQPPAIWPTEIWPDWRLPDLRAVILHVITETACHAGHLDAARELIDGRQWMT